MFNNAQIHDNDFDLNDLDNLEENENQNENHDLPPQEMEMQQRDHQMENPINQIHRNEQPPLPNNPPNNPFNEVPFVQNQRGEGERILSLQEEKRQLIKKIEKIKHYINRSLIPLVRSIDECLERYNDGSRMLNTIQQSNIVRKLRNEITGKTDTEIPNIAQIDFCKKIKVSVRTTYNHRIKDVLTIAQITQGDRTRFDRMKQRIFQLCDQVNIDVNDLNNPLMFRINNADRRELQRISEDLLVALNNCQIVQRKVLVFSSYRSDENKSFFREIKNILDRQYRFFTEEFQRDLPYFVKRATKLLYHGKEWNNLYGGPVNDLSYVKNFSYNNFAKPVIFITSPITKFGLFVARGLNQLTIRNNSLTNTVNHLSDQINEGCKSKIHFFQPSLKDKLSPEELQVLNNDSKLINLTEDERQTLSVPLSLREKRILERYPINPPNVNDPNHQEYTHANNKKDRLVELEKKRKVVETNRKRRESNRDRINEATLCLDQAADETIKHYMDKCILF